MNDTMNIYCSLLSEACEYTSSLDVLDESVKDLGKKVWGAIKSVLRWIKEKFIALGRRIKALVAKIFHKNKENKETKEPEKVEPFVEMKDVDFGEDKFHAGDIDTIAKEVEDIKKDILEYSKTLKKVYVDTDNEEDISDKGLLVHYDIMKNKNDTLFRTMDDKITLSELKRIQPICDRCAATIDTSISICDKSITVQVDPKVVKEHYRFKDSTRPIHIETLYWQRIASIDASWKKPILKMLTELLQPSCSKFMVMLGKIVTKFNEQESEAKTKEEQDADQKLKNDLADEQDKYKRDYSANVQDAMSSQVNNTKAADLARNNGVRYQERKYGTAATSNL